MGTDFRVGEWMGGLLDKKLETSLELEQGAMPTPPAVGNKNANITGRWSALKERGWWVGVQRESEVDGSPDATITPSNEPPPPARVRSPWTGCPRWNSPWCLEDKL